ncbi:unnamed protein product [Ilex paraguariensis]|uniref:Histone-lysine N-methyltransferase n=1 Tax=Ilex paraguariensis TaxID=185542 RepID=A0ABC8S8E4_9AQUA
MLVIGLVCVAAVVSKPPQTKERFAKQRENGLEFESPISKMPAKRLVENNRCECPSSPNIKRLKGDAIGQFPKHCGALDSRDGERNIEGIAGARNSEVGGEGAVLDVMPLSIWVPNDLPYSVMKTLVSHGKVDALETKMTGKNVEMDLPKELGKSELVNVVANGGQPRQIDIEWQSTALDFRQCGEWGASYRSNLTSTFRETISATRTLDTQVTIEQSYHCAKVHPQEIGDGYVQGRKLEQNVSKKNPEKVQHEPRQVNEMCKLVQEKTSDCDLKQEEDGDEVHILSPLEWNLLESGFKRQTVCNIDGVRSLVEKSCKDPEKCNRNNFCEVESGALAESQEVESFQLAPSFVHNLTAEQWGKRVFDCGFTESMCGYKGQNFDLMDVDRSKNVSGSNSTRNESLALGMKTAYHCMSSAFGNDEEHELILAAKESTDGSIVPYDEYQTLVSRNKVREAVNLFEEMYNKMFQEYKTKDPRKPVGQIHVEAAMVLKKQQKWGNADKHFLGHVPGVEVGDRFRFWAELVIIGLHRQFSSGIHYVKKDGKILATSIVASGRYSNNTESTDVLVYSGQGGNPATGDNKPEDQKLERGNLALKNSMDAKTPVRVILGHRRDSIYIYNGLYTVEEYWQERGSYGKLVFRFKLNRIPGLPKFTQQILIKPKKSKACFERCVADDVSGGKEKMCIRAMNALDDEKPPPFTYITNMIYSDWYDHSMPIGCDCTNGCSDSEQCSCALKNGGEIPFNNSGAIVRAKPVVYECGSSCKCPPSCMNRSTQHSVRYQLEVFKTESRGWGVRSQDFISSGSFICEYVGELLREKEAEERAGSDEYLFDIGNSQFDETEDDTFTIDAAQFGNVGRFINHSCSPNLYAQNVFYDHDDQRMPHVMLFASKNITPLRELTYDYNYKIDQVRDANGNIKKKNCYCGARGCTGRMY